MSPTLAAVHVKVFFLVCGEGHDLVKMTEDMPGYGGSGVHIHITPMYLKQRMRVEAVVSSVTT